MNDTPEQISLIPADISVMSNDELIAEHRKIGDHLTTQSKAFAEYCKPHREREDWIEKVLFARLAEMNRGKTEGKRASISTDHGTAYLSTIITPKVTDKTAFLDWILENWDERGGLLAIGSPVKEAFNSYVDETGGIPPHTETSTFTRVNIRRS